ncbi:cytochrome P450 [Xylariomycetidae sp. FL0641]|nr:cytochrome P450 [Xylariomycetidae sp. FL0641]
MSPPVFLIEALAVGLTLLGALKLVTIWRSSSRPLPPGPKPWPLIGNISDMPKPGEQEWIHWLKHKDVYGPISSITALGTTMVLLHSAELAFELMEKRSAIYSSRPHMVFGGDMVGWDQLMSLQPYGEPLRAYRKPAFAILGTKSSIRKFYPLLEVEVHRFLFRTLEKPTRMLGHLKTAAGAVVLKALYGYNIDPHGPDPLVDSIEVTLDHFARGSVPGVWLVDTIPALRYLPSWMPGAGFKRTAKEFRANLEAFIETPAEFVRRKMEQGQYERSYLSRMYEEEKRKGKTEEDPVAKGSAASLFGAGAETSASTLATFYLHVMLQPDIQRRAQEEIDRVVGAGRLPTFDDRADLPYVEAVHKEALRYHPISPMGLPHVSTEEDVCNGYLIPKGAVIVPNIWWYLHDPDIYPNPDVFDPSRHLGPDACRDPGDFVFGFGRRACPGKRLADASVWLTVARSLAVFDVSKGVDAAGKEIEPEIWYTPGVVSHPVPFQTTVRPRNAECERLIREVVTLHPWEESDADLVRSIAGRLD